MKKARPAPKRRHAPDPARILPALASLTVPLDSLKPDPKNPRTHDERNLAVLRASLTDFGQVKPIVVRDGMIVAGEGTWRAARGLRWRSIAAMPAEDLTLEQARAYGIVDNKSAMLAEWKFATLAELLRGMDPTIRGATGFADFEIEPLLEATFAGPGGGTGGGMVVFAVSQAEAAIINEAIAALRAREGAELEITEGRALELISADYLAAA